MSRKALQEAARNIARTTLDLDALRARRLATPSGEIPTYEDAVRRLLLLGLESPRAY